MQPGRSRPRSGVRGGGLWGPLHPYAALATSAFVAGARFRAQAAAGRPRNAPAAQSHPILGVFEILGASAAPFPCIGGVCLIVPPRGRYTIPGASRSRATQECARRPFASHTRSVLNLGRVYCPVPVYRLPLPPIVPSCPVARPVQDSGRKPQPGGPGTRPPPNCVPL